MESTTVQQNATPCLEPLGTFTKGIKMHIRDQVQSTRASASEMHAVVARTMADRPVVEGDAVDDTGKREGK